MTKATTVLKVIRMVPNSNNIDTLSPFSRRRPSARYDQVSAAINAPSEAGEDEEQVEHDKRTYDALEHNG